MRLARALMNARAVEPTPPVVATATALDDEDEGAEKNPLRELLAAEYPNGLKLACGKQLLPQLGQLPAWYDAMQAALARQRTKLAAEPAG